MVTYREIWENKVRQKEMKGTSAKQLVAQAIMYHYLILL